ncbi:MAG: hypothetical protein QOF51_526 [Chloroflexota bacterium]|nr:hypothetical protein [Chloroflexota bacterium]
MSAIRQPYLAPLTGVRFLAALGVVLFHLEHQFLDGLPDPLLQIIDRGYVGVGLFFVLSGFILVYTYATGSADGRIDARSFWSARIARIYPVYLLSFCLAAPLFFSSIFAQDPASVAAEKTALTIAIVPTMGEVWTLLPALLWHLPGWSFATPTLDWNFPAWSLCAEAFFYALFPLLVAWLARLSTRALITTLPLCWLLAVVAPVVYGLNPAATYPSDHQIAAWSWVINYTPIFRLPEFAFGAVLGQLFLRTATERWRQRQFWLSTIAAPLSLVLLFGCFIVIRDVPGLLLANGLFDPLFGLLIYSLAIGGGGLGWLLSRRPIVLLGEASYALYLLHVPIWDLLARLAGDTGRGAYASQIWYFWAYLAIAISLSVLTHLLVERPARRALRQLMNEWVTHPRPVPARVQPA